MVKTFDKNAQRMKRHTRVRGKISGTPERPRLNVYRSNANIYALSFSTAVVISITAVWQSLLRAPAKAAWNSNRRRMNNGLQ